MKTRVVGTILVFLILSAWVGPLPAAASDDAAVSVSASPAATAPDRTSQLARLIRRARAGSTVTLSAGTYRLNGPLEIDKSITLVGAGMDETVIESVYGPSMVRFTGPGELTLAGVTLDYVGEDGADVLVIADGTVDIAGSRFAGGVRTVDENLGGTGLLLLGASTGLVSDSRFEGNDLHGIGLVDQSQLTIDGNVLIENGQTGIAFFDASGGDVRNNDCSDNGLHGINVDGTASPVIESNICNGNGETGIRISDQAVVDVWLNEAARNGMSGIVVRADARAIVEENFANENQDFGILFVDQATGDARGNECSNNGLHGIGVEEQAEATIEDNQCTGNGATGIRLGGTTTSQVMNNVADGNQLHGIYVFDQAAPVLEDNIVRNNVEVGLAFFGEAGGVARGTECYGNFWGIYVEETANPTLEDYDCHDNTQADFDDRRQAELSATPTPMPDGQPPATGDILYADDFSDPSSGWEVGDWEEGSAWYGDRGLHLLNYTESEYKTRSGANQSFSDVVIEVDSQLVGGTDDNWHTIYCRRADGNNYYYVSYSADGYVHGQARVDGESVVTVDAAPSDAVNQGVDQVNHLRLACVGDTVRFWVNDELVVEFTDDNLTEGDIALGVTSLADEFSEVAFADLVVYAPGAAETAVQLAADAMTATVRSTGLNVRGGPGLQYPRVVEVRRGDHLPALGRDDTCTWILVDTSAGQGWVSSKYVDLSADCAQLPEVAAEP